MSDNEDAKEEKKPIVVKNAYDLQRLRLEKLMKNPDKPIVIPDAPKSKSLPPPPDFVRNVMGSSAGAGSGEFHVYRHLRRKEYARQKFIQEKSEKIEGLRLAFLQASAGWGLLRNVGINVMTMSKPNDYMFSDLQSKEKLDEEYRKKIEENKRKAEERTAKKRQKRLKRKKNAKLKEKKPKLNTSNTINSSQESNSSDDSENEKNIEVNSQSNISSIADKSDTIKRVIY